MTNADGRFVLFLSDASNLVSGDTNNIADVFVRDRATISNAQLSVSDVSVREGLISGNTLQFTVSLSSKSGSDVL
jgi:hypothetical protein